MQMFLWRSNLLAQYRRGHLVVLAETVDAARALVRAGFEGWVRENREWAWSDANGDFGEPDTEALDELRRRLDEDLSVDPTTHETLWLEGSE